MSYYVDLDDFDYEYLRIRLQLRKLMQDAWDNQHVKSISKWIYYLSLSRTATVNVVQTYRHVCPSDVIFPTAESAEEAVLLIGVDRLKKYYFCIKEKDGVDNEA